MPEDDNMRERSRLEKSAAATYPPKLADAVHHVQAFSFGAKTFVLQPPYDSFFEQLVELLRVHCRLV
jgi:hypothetical protein